jgi:hypothetical protein
MYSYKTVVIKIFWRHYQICQNGKIDTVRAGNLGHADNLGQAIFMFLLLQKSEFGLNILFLLLL